MVKIERSRNRRLWIKEIFMPIFWVGLVLFLISPEARGAVSEATEKIHKAVKEKIGNEQESEDAGINNNTESSD